jgi:16S rRNA (uracil1498-N3)-methyltransferase
MEFPCFYEASLPAGPEPFRLGEDTARHVTTVLRMRIGEKFYLTNGQGARVLVSLTASDRKQSLVTALALPETVQAPTALVVAVSLLKNPSRFEWLLEKCTEIGATAIVPLICARTERQHFRADRMRQVLVSAMLQSQQLWLPEMGEPQPISAFLSEAFSGRSYVAHCLPGEKAGLKTHPGGEPARILIGPEGDFTPDEIQQAFDKGFTAVSLGETRLRTETAAMVAAALLKNAMQGD